MAISIILKRIFWTIPILCLFWSPVQAQQVQCFPYDDLMERLHSLGERMTAAGIDGNGNLLQVLTSDSGAWSIVVRLEKGGTVYACPLSGGEGWQVVDPKRGRKS